MKKLAVMFALLGSVARAQDLPPTNEENKDIDQVITMSMGAYQIQVVTLRAQLKTVRAEKASLERQLADCYDVGCKRNKVKDGKDKFNTAPPIDPKTKLETGK